MFAELNILRTFIFLKSYILFAHILQTVSKAICFLLKKYQFTPLRSGFSGSRQFQTGPDVVYVNHSGKKNTNLPQKTRYENL